MFKSAFLIVVLLLNFMFSKAQDFDPELTDKMALQEKQYFFDKSAFIESENYAFYDLIYQRMEWEINPNIRYIKGSVTSYFKSKTSVLSEIEFDLHSYLTVDSVLQNKQKLDFNRIGNKLILPLQNNLEIGQVDSLAIFYQGEPPTGGGFGALEKNEHAGIPVIWTLSEPYGALEWWPCKQSLADKIDSIDIIVTCPEAFRTASNGILVLETSEMGKRKMHWKHRFPIATYLVAVAVTNYASYSDSLKLDDGRTIDILNYVYPENLEIAKSQTPRTAEIIELYNEKIGEYPFASEKYGHAQFGWGGGMEHQTMSFMNNFSFGLVAHELAHQWFGDYITLASWQDIWLNEGFATFMTGLAYENLSSTWWPRWKKLTVEQIIGQPGGSVFVKDTSNIGTLFSSRLSYSKGAYLLHMLRWMLGDEHFFAGIQNYFNDPEIANGFVRNEQFVKHMEMAGDTVLTEYFNDWYYGEGFPVYSAEFSPAGSGFIKIKLSQTTSHPSVDFFEMPVPVRVYNLDKSDSMDFRLNHLTNDQEFIVPVNFTVSELIIDPDYWLISKTSEIVSVKDFKTDGELFVYPNPFVDFVRVSVPNKQQITSIKLFSMNNKLLAEFNDNSGLINLSEFASGIYIIQVVTPQKTFEEKIVKL